MLMMRVSARWLRVRSLRRISDAIQRRVSVVDGSRGSGMTWNPIDFFRGRRMRVFPTPHSRTTKDAKSSPGSATKGHIAQRLPARWFLSVSVASSLPYPMPPKKSEANRSDAKPLPAPRYPDESFWVLRGTGREFYVCATITARGVAALCVFESEEGARRHLDGLTEFQMFLDTLDHHGSRLPSWVREESLMPQMVEVDRGEAARISRSIGVGYVALNPPAAGAKVEKIEVISAGVFAANAAKSETEGRRHGSAE